MTKPDSLKSRVLITRDLGLQPYQATWVAMRRFTDARQPGTPSELWLLEHPPVFTQGQAGKPEHLIEPGDIPVVQTDRGGQVTYHGPGQLIVYVLVDLRDAGVGVRRLVSLIEQSIIELLQRRGVTAQGRNQAPGVYVADRKIASLGLRVRRGCSYHGLALNVSNDLAPFKRINPCGFPGLSVTRTIDLGITDEVESLGSELSAVLAQMLGYETRRGPPILP